MQDKSLDSLVTTYCVYVVLLTYLLNSWQEFETKMEVLKLRKSLVEQKDLQLKKTLEKFEKYLMVWTTPFLFIIIIRQN